MTTLIHTADWQLGLNLNYIPGDRGARARLQRFDTVKAIAKLAHQKSVDTVVVAGDVFDANLVGPETLQMARDVMRAFHPIPLLLLPGNHDAGTADCVLRRLADGSEKLDHVRVLLDTDPVEIAGAVYYPCPLMRRHVIDDPTQHLPDRGTEQKPRIAIAHGGVLNFDQDAETPNIIDWQRVVDRGFDYLALGDWHGTMKVSDRVYYSGTHENTRFKENNAGNVLIVKIAEGGSLPVVQEHRVAETLWHKDANPRAINSSEDVAELKAWFNAIEERSKTMVRIKMEGTVSLDDRAELDQILRKQANELLYLRIKSDDVITTATDADIARMKVHGFLGHAMEQLDNADDPASRDALQLLHRFFSEEADQ